MTPDLITVIRSTELTVDRAKTIAAASEPLTEGFRVWDAWELGFFRRKPFLIVPALHDHLTDAADWNADHWDFEFEGRVRLARTLEWLYDRLPEPFRFSTTWGVVTTDEREIDRGDLLALIDSNKVGTGTLYRVGAAVA